MRKKLKPELDLESMPSARRSPISMRFGQKKPAQGLSPWAGNSFHKVYLIFLR